MEVSEVCLCVQQGKQSRHNLYHDVYLLASVEGEHVLKLHAPKLHHKVPAHGQKHQAGAEVEFRHTAPGHHDAVPQNGLGWLVIGILYCLNSKDSNVSPHTQDKPQQSAPLVLPMHHKLLDPDLLVLGRQHLLLDLWQGCICIFSS